MLDEARWDAAQGLISKEFVDKYIDKIFVTPEEDGSLRLQIKVLTGESTDKYLQNLKRRTGHTLKKMMPMRTARFEGADRTAAGHIHTVEYRAALRV